jgi:hypothetical protein
MVRREKARDLAKHPAPPGSSTPALNTPGPDTAGPDTAGPDTAGPDAPGLNAPDPSTPELPPAGSTTRQPDAAQLARRTGRPVVAN